MLLFLAIYCSGYVPSAIGSLQPLVISATDLEVAMAEWFGFIRVVCGNGAMICSSIKLIAEMI